MAKINIDFFVEDKLWKTHKEINKKLVKEIFVLVVDYLKIKTKNIIEFSISLSNDKEIKELNKEHRKKDKPTNVLTFSVYEDFEEINNSIKNLPHTLLGDIIFSFDTIKTESEEQNKAFLNHFIHLLIHSYLHLFCYDHIEEEEQVVMEAIEIELLGLLGIDNPYV